MRFFTFAALLAMACAPADSDIATTPQPTGARADGRGLLPLATPCTIASGVVTVSLAGNEVASLALDGSNRLTVNGTPCSTATSLTVTRINISAADLVTASDETVIIDGSNGFFSPGSSSSQGIVISLGAGSADSVEVIGGSGDDVLVTGRSTTDDWVIFNHDLFKDLSMTGVELISLTGGTGNDTLSGSSRVPAWVTTSYFSTGLASQRVLTLNGGIGNDLLIGGDGDDQLLGGAGDDSLNGGLGNDSENGEAGNDTFDQGAATNGGDVLIGGSETDTVTYTARTVNLTVTVGSIANDGAAGENDDVRSDIEVVIGGSGRDVLTCASSVGCTLRGGLGDDVLTGRNGSDDLEGEAGDDVLQPGPGDDVVNGGPGIDTVTYADAASAVTVVLGTSGTPTTGNGTSGENDSLDALENLIGSPFNDTLTGNAGDNRIAGGLGNDTLSGGAGNDTFDEGSATNGQDTFVGGAGEDRVDYSARTLSVGVTLDGSADDGQANEQDNVGTDVEDVSGGAGDDVLIGNGFDNKLDGNSGDDAMDGAGGNDELTGGPGADTLLGGAGDDILEGEACDCGTGFDIAVCTTAPANCEVR